MRMTVIRCRPINARPTRTVGCMSFHVPDGQLTAAQAIAWLAFRDASKADFSDIGDLVPVAIELEQSPPDPSGEEDRLYALSRSEHLTKNDRRAAHLAAQDLWVRRMEGKSRFLRDPATNEIVVEWKSRKRGPSALVALEVAHGLTSNDRQYLRPHDAVSALKEACANGHITATGLSNGRGDRQKIPALWWAEGVFCDGDESYAIVARGGKDSTEWHALLFDQAAIERKWPLPPTPPAKYVPFLDRQERKSGPKRGYIKQLYALLLGWRRTKIDLYQCTPHSLVREIHLAWQVSWPPLPPTASKRSTTLEDAIAAVKKGIAEDISAGVAPEIVPIPPKLSAKWLDKPASK
jgi:hypothetical protein